MGGWAFLHYSPDGSVFENSGHSPSTTNNRMELTATIEALRRVKNGDSDRESERGSQSHQASALVPIILLTDSVYVIRGITQWIFGWQRRGWKNAEGNDILNKDLWEALYKVTRGQKIEWRYVRGHTGITGNERVDSLAVAHSKRAPLSPYRGPVETYLFSLFPLPPLAPLPEMKKNNSGASSKTPLYYLSLVHGILERHENWASCQGRISGVSQAKFKKIQSEEEADATIRAWGLNPQSIPLKR